MILGLGLDIVQIPRIEKLQNKFGNRFLLKFFTESEIETSQKFSNKQKQTAYLAKRFSAKEAFSKATGLGIGRGINFNDIEILNDIMGKPYIKISKSGVEFLEEHFKIPFNKIDIHTSVSDDYPVAQAIVIITQKG